jgi:hypothetical protein
LTTTKWAARTFGSTAPYLAGPSPPAPQSQLNLNLNLYFYLNFSLCVTSFSDALFNSSAACIVGIALTIIMSLLQRAASKSSAKATSPAESAKKSN